MSPHLAAPRSDRHPGHWSAPQGPHLAPRQPLGRQPRPLLPSQVRQPASLSSHQPHQPHLPHPQPPPGWQAPQSLHLRQRPPPVAGRRRRLQMQSRPATHLLHRSPRRWSRLLQSSLHAGLRYLPSRQPLHWRRRHCQRPHRCLSGCHRRLRKGRSCCQTARW